MIISVADAVKVHRATPTKRILPEHLKLWVGNERSEGKDSTVLMSRTTGFTKPFGVGPQYIVCTDDIPQF